MYAKNERKLRYVLFVGDTVHLTLRRCCNQPKRIAPGLIAGGYFLWKEDKHHD